MNEKKKVIFIFYYNFGIVVGVVGRILSFIDKIFIVFCFKVVYLYDRYRVNESYLVFIVGCEFVFVFILYNLYFWRFSNFVF